MEIRDLDSESQLEETNKRLVIFGLARQTRNLLGGEEVRDFAQVDTSVFYTTGDLVFVVGEIYDNVPEKTQVMCDYLDFYKGGLGEFSYRSVMRLLSFTEEPGARLYGVDSVKLLTRMLTMARMWKREPLTEAKYLLSSARDVVDEFYGTGYNNFLTAGERGNFIHNVESSGIVETAADLLQDLTAFSSYVRTVVSVVRYHEFLRDMNGEND